jgi:hypothetical protein
LRLFGLSLTFPFVIHVMVPTIKFFIEFFMFVVSTNGILSQRSFYLCTSPIKMQIHYLLYEQHALLLSLPKRLFWPKQKGGC